MNFQFEKYNIYSGFRFQNEFFSDFNEQKRAFTNYKTKNTSIALFQNKIELIKFEQLKI